MHHAYVLEGDLEQGAERALTCVAAELGLAADHPDVVVLRHGLLSVEDARKIGELASRSPVEGEAKALVITAARLYHEAQNALLKLFEEPTPGTHLFLVVPTVGTLLPTLRSRVLMLSEEGEDVTTNKDTLTFLNASPDKRSAIIKKLTNGKDEDERRAGRDGALTLVNDIERLAARDVQKHRTLLTELSAFRAHLQERSAPVKQILEHVAIVVPKGLV